MRLLRKAGTLIKSLSILIAFPCLSFAGTPAVSIVSINAHDTGNGTSASSSYSLDTTRDTCTSGSLETFHDSVLTVSVKNSTYASLNITRFSITISSLSGAKIYSSKSFPPSSSTTIAPKATGDSTLLLMTINDTAKNFIGSSQTVDGGVRNVAVRLRAVNSVGRAFTLTRRLTLNFTNVDNCS